MMHMQYSMTFGKNGQHCWIRFHKKEFNMPSATWEKLPDEEMANIKFQNDPPV